MNPSNSNNMYDTINRIAESTYGSIKLSGYSDISNFKGSLKDIRSALHDAHFDDKQRAGDIREGKLSHEMDDHAKALRELQFEQEKSDAMAKRAILAMENESTIKEATRAARKRDRLYDDAEEKSEYRHMFETHKRNKIRIQEFEKAVNLADATEALMTASQEEDIARLCLSHATQSINRQQSAELAEFTLDYLRSNLK